MIFIKPSKFPKGFFGLGEFLLNFHIHFIFGTKQDTFFHISNILSKDVANGRKHNDLS